MTPPVDCFIGETQVAGRQAGQTISHRGGRQIHCTYYYSNLHLFVPSVILLFLPVLLAKQRNNNKMSRFILSSSQPTTTWLEQQQPPKEYEGALFCIFFHFCWNGVPFRQPKASCRPQLLLAGWLASRFIRTWGLCSIRFLGWHIQKQQGKWAPMYREPFKVRNEIIIDWGREDENNNDDDDVYYLMRRRNVE